MNIFPEQELSKTESDLLAEMYSNPVVVKHLHMLAYNIGKELVTAVPNANETAEEWMRKELYLKGQLANIDTLLSISVEAAASKSSNQ